MIVLSGAQVLAVEWLVAVIAWTVVTFHYRREVLRVFPTTRSLMLLLVWASLFAQGTRTAWGFGLISDEWVELSAGIVRGLFALVGLSLAIGFARARRTKNGRKA